MTVLKRHRKLAHCTEVSIIRFSGLLTDLVNEDGVDFIQAKISVIINVIAVYFGPIGMTKSRYAIAADAAGALAAVYFCLFLLV